MQPLLNTAPNHPGMFPEPRPAADESPLEQACAWLALLHGGRLDEAGREKLRTWRAADPAHEQAWQKAQSVWTAMEDLRERKIPGARPLASERYLPRRTRPWPRLLAACLALLAFSLLQLYPPAYWQADYVTAKGEQRDILLPDGSRVRLNTATLLALHFSEKTRQVELLEGEAFFEVAKDPARPFIVSSEEGSVRAIGTAFSVRRQAPLMRVELLHGVVEVSQAQQTGKRMTVGQTAEIGAEGVRIGKESPPDALAAWREGYLLLDGAPVAEAVAQINRYRPGRVLLLDNALAARRVSGLFRLDALDQALDAIATAVSARKQTVASYLVILH